MLLLMKIEHFKYLYSKEFIKIKYMIIIKYGIKNEKYQ